MKTAALVTIRLNSKRVPQKNIKLLGSKPMCWYMIDSLLQVGEIDQVYVYCSDPAIKDYIPKDAIFLQREKWLDGDEIKARDTYSAFINEIDADVYVAACSTSPFTKAETLKKGVASVVSGSHDSAFSVKRVQTFAWYQGKPINYCLSDIPRTQDLTPIFMETSAFFIFKKDIWTVHGRRIGFNPHMCEVGEIEAIDIDTQEDFDFASKIMQYGKGF